MTLKSGTRLYVNVTNRCNTDCPFCCMFSGTDKGTFMGFDVFKGIIDGCEGKFELQLEGGEPLLHDGLFLFIEYALSTGRCEKILILTNGIELERHLRRIVEIANWNNVPFEIKVSVNYWLVSTQKDFLYRMNLLLFSVAFMDYVKMTFNVRIRNSGDEWLIQDLRRYGLYDNSNIFHFQSYGRLTDSDYEKPVIVQNIEDWRIYSCDGTCFGQDLIARSNYEGTLR